MDKFSPLGTDLFGDVVLPPNAGALSARYNFPPFSVLDARAGDWQHRKRSWISMGIEGGSGRSSDLIFDLETRQDFTGKAFRQAGSGTSQFDPVLAELSYNWFCPAGGRILDPFSGGSTRGAVAHYLGFEYLGYDVRAEQIDANYEQIRQPGIRWIHSDIRDYPPPRKAPADFIFTCPPYGDLEKYSEQDDDISTMQFEDFMFNYRRIIDAACHSLHDDRFAAIVVGDFRCKKTGIYRNFPALTTEAFRVAGLELYNEAVLLTSAASMALRCESIFGRTRKLVKGHQNLMVYVKGDPRKAAKLIIGE